MRFSILSNLECLSSRAGGSYIRLALADIQHEENGINRIPSFAELYNVEQISATAKRA